MEKRYEIFVLGYRAQRKCKELKEKIHKESSDSTSLVELQKALQDVEKEAKSMKDLEDDLKKKEKLTPWNVDTIGQDGFTKTVINKKAARKDEDAGLTDEEKEIKMKQFVKDNEKALKQYGMLRKYDDSKQFLQQNLHLVCENTANYLVIWCINLEMEEVRWYTLTNDKSTIVLIFT